MQDIDNESTRRRFLKAGTGVALGGLVAGCTGRGEAPATEGTTDDTPTEQGRDAATTTPAESYTVSMEPVGTVEFDDVPDSIAVWNPGYIDMLVALGHAEAVESVWYRARYKTLHYDELPGVSIDVSGLTQLWNDGVSKEPFYEMDADLHLMDPHALTDWFQVWKQSDVEEIRTRIAPFLGNVIFRRTDDWHDYRYYTLYEAFEKVAAVVRERERFEMLRSIHEDLVSDVQSRLPPEGERPNALLLFSGEEPEQFVPYRVSGKGTNKEHFRTLGIRDAFSGTDVGGYSTKDQGKIDYETLLEIDPDSLLLRTHGNKTRADFEEAVLSYMQDHELGSQLTAVQNGRVFRGGPIYCGPLHNLFLTERYAKAYFPEIFTAEQLFDRERVAAIIRGED